jgi:hypothetical protein
VINLSKNPIDDYRFCLSDGNLQEGIAAEIFQGSSINSPTLNAAGGFDDYRPIDVLDPYSTYIIELK